MSVIGIVGPIGSGCSYVAGILREKHNFQVISLSEILRKIPLDTKGNIESSCEFLQNKGNAIRKDNGKDYLAQEALRLINENPDLDYVVDSIRNPAEILFLRENCAGFFLFGIFADADIRWGRSEVQRKFHGNRSDFDTADERDSGKKEPEYGQKVTDSFRMADIVILNNENIMHGNKAYRDFAALIKEKIDIIKKVNPFRPNEVETNMALAYAVSMRSSCLKKRVGAIIIDAQGAVFSSGYNEVPSTQKTCSNEYGMCYRDKMKEDFKSDLKGIIDDASTQELVYERFKKFKILDYCRALHAEENAILNVARLGASSVLSSAVLYTSTYPCNLCANKIAQVGIREIVYFEPYPMVEAKKILTEKGITQTPFQGITYNGYFRLMEVVD